MGVDVTNSKKYAIIFSDFKNLGLNLLFVLDDWDIFYVGLIVMWCFKVWIIWY